MQHAGLSYIIRKKRDHLQNYFLQFTYIHSEAICLHNLCDYNYILQLQKTKYHSLLGTLSYLFLNSQGNMFLIL